MAAEVPGPHPRSPGHRQAQLAAGENRNCVLRTPICASERYPRDPGNLLSVDGHCRYFTAEQSCPCAKGRQRLLFTRWELSGGRLGPRDTEPLAGKRATSSDPALSRSSARFVSPSDGKDVQTAALQPQTLLPHELRWAESAAPAPTAAAGAAAAEPPGMQRGCAPLLPHTQRQAPGIAPGRAAAAGFLCAGHCVGQLQVVSDPRPGSQASRRAGSAHALSRLQSERAERAGLGWRDQPPRGQSHPRRLCTLDSDLMAVRTRDAPRSRARPV